MTKDDRGEETNPYGTFGGNGSKIGTSIPTNNIRVPRSTMHLLLNVVFGVFVFGVLYVQVQSLHFDSSGGIEIDEIPQTIGSSKSSLTDADAVEELHALKRKGHHKKHHNHGSSSRSHTDDEVVPSAEDESSAEDTDDNFAQGDDEFFCENAHIVFFLVDDQGFNDIGYNTLDLDGASPTIDNMAKSGIILDNYYSQHLCTPSRAALMTGVLPYHMGMQHEVILPSAPWGVPLDHMMLPEYLSQQGYKSHIVGKWHLGFHLKEYMPTARGFDSFFGYLSDQENYYDREYPYPIGGIYFKDWIHVQQDGTKNFVDQAGNYSLDMITNKAANIISSHSSEYPSNSLFLFVSFQTLHGPLEAPPAHTLDDKQIAMLNTIPNEQRKKFSRMLMATDHSIDQIVTSLTSNDLISKTVIIYSSDNGACHLSGGYNSPLRGGKHYLFEGGLRVHGFMYSQMFLDTPLSGTRFPGLMHISDWLPTILHMTGNASAIPDSIDGLSQWRAIQWLQKPPREVLVHNIDRWVTMANGSTEWLAPLNKSRAAIRVGDMKLITNEYVIPWYSPHDADEDDDTTLGEFHYIQDCENAPNEGINTFLFNISSDPFEMNNLAEVHPDMVVELSALIEALASEMVDPVWQPEEMTAVIAWSQAGGYFCPWSSENTNEPTTDGDMV